MSTETSIATGSLWRCATQTGWCVVRVEGQQSSLVGDVTKVVVVVARRGAPTLTFKGNGGRALSVRGFLRRYRPVGAAEATEKVRISRARPGKTRGKAMTTATTQTTQKPAEPKTKAAVKRPKQGVIAGADAAAEKPQDDPWAFDAVVLHAGVGGCAAGLREIGLRVLGVDGVEETAKAHRANGSPCVFADVSKWKPRGTARVVFCLQPASTPGDDEPTPAAEVTVAGEAPVAPANDDQGVDVAKLLPAERVLFHAVRAAADCKAGVIVVEVRGGKRGSGRCRDWASWLLSREGYHAMAQEFDAAYLGLPAHRTTSFVVGVRGGLRSDVGFRWPAMTHAPRGGVLKLPPFVAAGDALGATNHPSALGEDGKPLANAFKMLDPREPAPEFGPSGPDGHLVELRDVEVKDEGQPPAELARLVEASKGKRVAVAVRLTPTQVAALLGLPQACELGAKRNARRNAASVFPPLLSRLMGRAAMGYIDECDAARGRAAVALPEATDADATPAPGEPG